MVRDHEPLLGAHPQTLTDHGKVIPGGTEEDIPRALTRFGQIEGAMTRRTQGTGLGLPLVKQLVELHGGTVTITSNKGQGTRVEILFPKDDVQAADATAT